MLWEIEHLKDQNYVTVIIEGEFNLADNLKLLENIISVEYWQPGMNLLFDSRKIDLIKSDVDELREAGKNMAAFNNQLGSGKVAVLMATVYNFGKGRQFEMLAEKKISVGIKIFMDENQALDWLAGH